MLHHFKTVTRIFALTTVVAVITESTWAEGYQPSTFQISAARQSTPKETTRTQQNFAPEALGLSKDDWSRYQSLMHGPLGQWNANMDPILALGIAAKSEAEQRRFAILYAKQEYALTQKTLAFERAYRREFSRLFADAPIIRTESLEDYFRAKSEKNDSPQLFDSGANPNFQSGDRLLFFPPFENCFHCPSTLSRLSDWANTHPTLHVDMYVVGARNEQAVKDWAVRNSWERWGFPQGQLSLDLNDALWELLKAQSASTASLFLQRGEQIFRLEEALW